MSPCLARKYAHRLHTWHRSFPSCLAGLFVRLAELFVSLAGFGFLETKFAKLLETRYFFLPILFWKLANNKIWKTNFAKQLEMFLLAKHHVNEINERISLSEYSHKGTNYVMLNVI